MVKYFFREPVFPILVETDYRVFGIYNSEEFDQLVQKQRFCAKENYDVVDSTGEGWSYFAEYNVISPLIMHKRWYKKEIIEFINKPLYKLGIKVLYVGKSLSAKNKSAIIKEISEFSKELENSE